MPNVAFNLTVAKAKAPALPADYEPLDPVDPIKVTFKGKGKGPSIAKKRKRDDGDDGNGNDEDEDGSGMEDDDDDGACAKPKTRQECAGYAMRMPGRKRGPDMRGIAPHAAELAF